MSEPFTGLVAVEIDGAVRQVRLTRAAFMPEMIHFFDEFRRSH